MRILRVHAMENKPAARCHRPAVMGARSPRRPLHRPRRRSGRRRGRDLGQPVAVRACRAHRRAARRIQSQGPGLGPAAADTATADCRRLRAVPRNLAPQHAARRREQLLPAGLRPDPVAVPKMTDELMVALHTYLARSAAELMLVQPEDIFGQCEQANLPGTVDQHPNWRRKLALNIDAWRDDRRIQALTQVLRAERGVRPRAAEAAATASAGHPAQALPSSTYRLQFNRDFTFVMATELIPYLNALGVSHCYASPYLKDRPGSPPGYDIIDHNALNPEIGSTEDFERFVAALHRHDMSHILDMVPNHMGIMGSDNMWWLDVLENGQASVYADYFDIDWEAMRGPYRHKVLLPVLGDHYGVVLERGELQIKFDREGGAFSIWYFSHRFPIDPKEYPQILGYRGERLAQRLGAENADLLEYESLIAAFRNLPARNEAG